MIIWHKEFQTNFAYICCSFVLKANVANIPRQPKYRPTVAGIVLDASIAT